MWSQDASRRFHRVCSYGLRLLRGSRTRSSSLRLAPTSRCGSPSRGLPLRIDDSASTRSERGEAGGPTHRPPPCGPLTTPHRVRPSRRSGEWNPAGRTGPAYLSPRSPTSVGGVSGRGLDGPTLSPRQSFSRGDRGGRQTPARPWSRRAPRPSYGIEGPTSRSETTSGQLGGGVHRPNGFDKSPGPET